MSNTRTDQYGGSLENRIRYPLRITSSIRKAWQKPLFYRLSATDWADGPEKDENGEWRQWGLEQSKILVGEIEKLGVDLVDVSTGGNWEKQSIPIGPGYQVRLTVVSKHYYYPRLVCSHETNCAGSIRRGTQESPPQTCVQRCGFDHLAEAGGILSARRQDRRYIYRA